MKSLFTISNLNFSFGEVSIFRDFSLAIPVQKITVLMGVSGSGKSTLLRLLNRLLSPSSGQILYADQNTQAIPVLELRRKVLLVPQLRALPEELVKDFILYGPTLHRETVDPQVLTNLTRDVLLDGSVLNKQVRDLSSGELQRVNLMRAILNKPDVLLLDEPTANLDLNTTLKIETVIMDLVNKFNLSVLWVTHDEAQASRLGVNPIKIGRGERDE